MKTASLTALLLLGMLATTTTALALPPDPVVACVTDLTDGDGQRDRIGPVWVAVDALDQDGAPACQ